MQEVYRAKGVDEKDKNTWYYGHYWKTQDTTFCFAEDYATHPQNTHHYILFDQMTDWGLPNRKLRADINPDTLGKFIGIKDTEGKAIFQGDIVTRTDIHPAKEPTVGVIEYDVENTAFVIHWIDKPMYSPMYPWKNRIKVTGNIHDKEETEC